MTKSEAIKILKKPIEHIKIYDDDFVFSSNFVKAYEIAIKALEENQQYETIGTVEEFKALKEKSVTKKIVYVPSTVIKIPHCPNCNMELTMGMYLKKFCNCGQKLDWQ